MCVCVRVCIHTRIYLIHAITADKSNWKTSQKAEVDYL